MTTKLLLKKSFISNTNVIINVEILIIEVESELIIMFVGPPLNSDDQFEIILPVTIYIFKIIGSAMAEAANLNKYFR